MEIMVPNFSFIIYDKDDVKLLVNMEFHPETIVTYIFNVESGLFFSSITDSKSLAKRFKTLEDFKKYVIDTVESQTIEILWDDDVIKMYFRRGLKSQEEIMFIVTSKMPSEADLPFVIDKLTDEKLIFMLNMADLESVKNQVKNIVRINKTSRGDDMQFFVERGGFGLREIITEALEERKDSIQSEASSIMEESAEIDNKPRPSDARAAFLDLLPGNDEKKVRVTTGFEAKTLKKFCNQYLNLKTDYTLAQSEATVQMFKKHSRILEFVSTRQLHIFAISQFELSEDSRKEIEKRKVIFRDRSISQISRYLDEFKCNFLHLEDLNYAEESQLNVLEKVEKVNLVFTPFKLTSDEYHNLNCLKTVSLLNLKMNDVDESLTASLCKISQLKKLNLSQNYIGDEGCEHLTSLTQLTHLWLAGNNVTNDGCQHLSKLTQLEFLDLDENDISFGCEKLADIRCLKALYINNNMLTSADLRILMSLPKLVELDVSNNKISHADLSLCDDTGIMRKLWLGTNRIGNSSCLELKKLSNLVFLSLEKNFLTKVGCQNLRELSNLACLNISNNAIGDVGVEYLSEIEGLVQLDLSFCNVTDDAIKFIHELTKLERLDLHSNRISTIDLADLDHLKYFNVADNKLEEKNRFWLGKTEILEEFNVSYNNKIGTLDLLEELVNLKICQLFDCKIGKKQIKNLYYCQKIVKLDLGKNEIDDYCCIGLKFLENLQWLNLESNLVGNRGIYKLRKLSLVYLNLGNNKFDNEGCKYLSEITTLKELIVPFNRINSAGASYLFNLPELTDLDVSKCQLNYRLCKANPKGEELKNLTLSGNDMGKTGAEFFNALNCMLVELYLDSCFIGDEGCCYLEDLKTVQILDLKNNELTDECCVYVSGMKYLTELSMSYNNISENGMKELCNLKELKKLMVSHNQIDSEAAWHLSRLEELVVLDLDYNFVSDEGCSYLSKLKYLTHLNLAGNDISHEGCSYLGNMEALTNLNLSDNENVKNEGIQYISELPMLNYLDVSSCSLDKQACEFLAQMNSLNMLDISTNKIEFAGGIENLIDLPSLFAISVKNTSIKFGEILKIKEKIKFVISTEDKMKEKLNKLFK